MKIHPYGTHTGKFCFVSYGLPLVVEYCLLSVEYLIPLMSWHLIKPTANNIESINYNMMTKYNLTYNWYALYTRPRWEKKVYNELNISGFEAYLPLVKKVKQWSDRKKTVEEPLIKSYVFVKTSEKEYFDILNVDGAIRYIFFEGKAAPIPEWQIDALRKTIENKLSFKLTNKKLKPGEIINIKEGPLKGSKGEIIKIKGKSKLLIRIENIGYNLVIETEVENLG